MKFKNSVLLVISIQGIGHFQVTDTLPIFGSDNKGYFYLNQQYKEALQKGDVSNALGKLRAIRAAVVADEANIKNLSYLRAFLNNLDFDTVAKIDAKIQAAGKVGGLAGEVLDVKTAAELAKFKADAEAEIQRLKQKHDNETAELLAEIQRLKAQAAAQVGVPVAPAAPGAPEAPQAPAAPDAPGAPEAPAAPHVETPEEKKAKEDKAIADKAKAAEAKLKRDLAEAEKAAKAKALNLLRKAQSAVVADLQARYDRIIAEAAKAKLTLAVILGRNNLSFVADAMKNLKSDTGINPMPEANFKERVQNLEALISAFDQSVKAKNGKALEVLVVKIQQEAKEKKDQEDKAKEQKAAVAAKAEITKLLPAYKKEFDTARLEKTNFGTDAKSGKTNIEVIKLFNVKIDKLSTDLDKLGTKELITRKNDLAGMADDIRTGIKVYNAPVKPDGSPMSEQDILAAKSSWGIKARRQLAGDVAPAVGPAVPAAAQPAQLSPAALAAAALKAGAGKKEAALPDLSGDIAKLQASGLYKDAAMKKYIDTFEVEAKDLAKTQDAKRYNALKKYVDMLSKLKGVPSLAEKTQIKTFAEDLETEHEMAE